MKDLNEALAEITAIRIEITGQGDIKTLTGRVVGKPSARLGHGVEDANGGERASAT